MKSIGKFVVWSMFAIFAISLISSFSANTGEKKVQPETNETRESRCKWEIKQGLKDPSSLQVVRVLHAKLDDGGNRVFVKYRAKNSFGALVVEEDFCDFKPVK